LANQAFSTKKVVTPCDGEHSLLPGTPENGNLHPAGLNKIDGIRGFALRKDLFTFPNADCMLAF
jgi:hypothetical protein